MIKIRTKPISLIICLLLVFISFTGCISPTELVPTPEGPIRRPNNPSITIDKQENVHILWTIGYYGSSNICYSKLKNNHIEINKKSITFDWMSGTKSIIDSSNNIHLFFLSKLSLNENWNIYYLKLNNHGEILINTKKICKTDFTSITTTTSLFDVSMDSQKNIYILWLKDDRNTSGFMKLDIDGEILFETSLSDFFKNINFSHELPIFILHTEIDSNYTLHAVWNGGYNQLNIKDFTFSRTFKNINGKGIAIDTRDNIYILSSKNLTKLDCNNSILSSETLFKVSTIPGYPIIIGDDGNYLYLGSNGSLDSDNNLHLWSIKVESEIVGRREEDYHTIYYNKIGINGTVLINNLVIDSDRESSWEEQIDAMSIAIIFMIAIPILIAIIIIIYWYFKKSKQDNEKR